MQVYRNLGLALLIHESVGRCTITRVTRTVKEEYIRILYAVKITWQNTVRFSACIRNISSLVSNPDLGSKSWSQIAAEEN